MYKLLIRPLFFLIDPESIHHFTFSLLRLINKLPGGRSVLQALFSFQHPSLEKELLGLKFKNPVGLAAGFDKDALLLDELPALGFSFIEIGTLTPKPQAGNAKPRLFRLPADEAIINRMGFNNRGVMDAVERLKHRKTRGIIVGGNIGKNKTTSNELAIEDYAYCFDALHPFVDYFVVNVSSPNTPNLRDLQEKEPLKKLLSTIKGLNSQRPDQKPVLLKIAPDLSEKQLDDVIEILRETKTDGVIATNTTISRAGLLTGASRLEKIGGGGLSGRPLASRSNEVITYLRKRMGNDYPIIGVGGVMSAEDAVEKIKSGADLVQIYTGFIYEGPGFIKKINKALVRNIGKGKTGGKGQPAVLADSIN